MAIVWAYYLKSDGFTKDDLVNHLRQLKEVRYNLSLLRQHYPKNDSLDEMLAEVDQAIEDGKRK